MKTKGDKETLSVVHDDDFVGFLQRVGVYEDVVAGKYHCHFCEKEITIDNISNVFSENGHVRFVCDDLKCVIRLSQHITRKS